MNLKFTLFLLALPFFAWSQNKISIDLVGGIDYTYRIIDPVEPSSVFYIRKTEDPKINWRVGFNVNIRIKENLYLKTGLRLFTTGFLGAEDKDVRHPSEFDDMGVWTPDPSLPHEIRVTTAPWFIELPLIARYAFSPEKKWSPFVELGVSPARHIRTRTIVETDLYDDSYFSGPISFNFNEFQLLGIASFGVNYAYNQQLQFFAQMVGRYQIIEMFDGATSQTNIFDVGLELGARRWIR